MAILRRLYLDNYKCLVNFDFVLNPTISLLLGSNGSGKSSIFDALLNLRDFAGLGLRAENVFSTYNLTRWMRSTLQTFSLEVDIDGERYRYELRVDLGDRNHPEVLNEHLWLGEEKTLIRARSGNVDLYRDDFSLETSYPLDPSLSAVALIPTLNEQRIRIRRFKEFLNRLIVVQLNPVQMNPVSAREERLLNRNSANFVSWYRYISQDQGLTVRITQMLKEVLEGFSHLQFVELGELDRGLNAYFQSENGGRPYRYTFYELSDGQRVLLALYSLLEYAHENGYTLCIDEPENFLALAEIQPWLVLLHDYSLEGKLQALLISHHPELINYLAAVNGIWIDREMNGPSRVQSVDVETGGLPIAELVARGWIDGSARSGDGLHTRNRWRSWS